MIVESASSQSPVNNSQPKNKLKKIFCGLVVVFLIGLAAIAAVWHLGSR